MFSSTFEECAQDACLHDALAQAGYKTGPELVDALSEHPHVVAWIGGHAHQHRIEPKGGFWNIETSSLIDLPQESRIVEVWITADAEKGFFAMKRLSHDFEKSRELAQGDPQADPEAAGQALDQDVILWFDVPADVDVRPQPALPRSLVATQTAPGEAAVGQEATLRLHVKDSRFGAPVDGLDVSAAIDRADEDEGVAGVLREQMRGVGGGDYELNFTPDAPRVHFVRYTVADPTGTYPELARSVSLEVEGEQEKASAKKSPAPGVLLVLLAALWMRRR